MNAEVDRYYDGKPNVQWLGPKSGFPEGTVLVQLRVSHPPSRKGGHVALFLTPEDVTNLLLDLREAAIHARRRPMED